MKILHFKRSLKHETEKMANFRLEILLMTNIFVSNQFYNSNMK